MAPEWQKWFVITLIALLVISLIFDRIKPHILFVGSVFLLLLTGIMTPSVLLQSFSNESIITIFILVWITAAINKNFNILKKLDHFFTKKQNPNIFVAQLTAMVSGVSAFVNNTPIVALMLPYVLRWSKRMNVAPSKLLIPLSYAALTGGMITVIGTSTNLVLNGFIESSGMQMLTFRDFIIPGLLVSIGGMLLLSTLGVFILPQRENPLQQVQENLKEYLVEVQVAAQSPFHGQTIQQAGLRNLQSVYLAEILRGEKIISAVSPDQKIFAGDRLFFAGDTKDIFEIIKEDGGLAFSKTDQYQFDADINIVEAMIPYNSNLVGKTLKESNFRQVYDAAVVALHRKGERLRGKLGEIRLMAGDILMLTAGSRFEQNVSQDNDLYSIGIKDHVKKTTSIQAKVLAVVSIVFLALYFLDILPFFVSLIAILGAFLGFGLFSSNDLKKEFNLNLFLILGSALAIGQMFIATGGAKWVADGAMQIFSIYGNLGTLLGVFFLAVLFTQFVTNTAALSIVYPVVFEIAKTVTFDPNALFLALAFGASCSFITPFGYQTNLMIYGPGGYKFMDFVRIGLPMTLVYSLLALGWLIFKFQII
ncbi:MAG: SLC13 family permease [Weeksellaceae bacterium]|nr:SLC13 family permease [Weeksellaceae bacterium]